MLSTRASVGQKLRYFRILQQGSGDSTEYELGQTRMTIETGNDQVGVHFGSVRKDRRPGCIPCRVEALN